MSGHPLGEVAKDLARFTDCTSGTAEGRDGREVRVGGLLTGLRETRTKRGKRMGFATLEDLEGSFDLVIFSDPYSLYLDVLRMAEDGAEPGQGPVPLLVGGTLEEGDPPKILVREVMRLDEGDQRLTTYLRLRVLANEAGCDRMEALRKVLLAHPGDCEVMVHITIPGESETIVSVDGLRGVEASDDLQRDVDALFGRSVAERSL